MYEGFHPGALSNDYSIVDHQSGQAWTEFNSLWTVDSESKEDLPPKLTQTIMPKYGYLM